jgi:hypothetical protein
MKGLVSRWRSSTRAAAGASKVATATRPLREVTHEQRQLARRGKLPPASARDVATRELLRGNWRPPIA